MAFDLAGLLNQPKTAIIKAVQAQKEMPPMVKIALSGGLAMMSDPDYLRYGRMINQMVEALSETERGRSLLDEIGIQYADPDPIPAGQN